MQGEAFTLLAGALVGMDDADLETTMVAAAGVIASRHDASVPAVLAHASDSVNASALDVPCLLACGAAARDQIAAAQVTTHDLVFLSQRHDEPH